MRGPVLRVRAFSLCCESRFDSRTNGTCRDQRAPHGQESAKVLFLEKTGGCSLRSENRMRTNNYVVAWAGLFLSVLLLSVQCSDGPPSGPENDPPMIEILFPTAGSYDRDQDGLVDIEVAFRDTGSGLNEQSLEIRSNRPLGPSGTGGTNILDSFEIVVRDSLHIVLEETTEALLPYGETDVVIEVNDRLDNHVEETMRLDLPAGAFHKQMPSPVPDRIPIGIEMIPGVPGESDALGALLSDSELIPFDPFSLEFGPAIGFTFFQSPVDGEWYSSRRRLFIVSDLNPVVLPFDPVTSSFESPIPVSARSSGISQGPTGDLYLASVTTPASISIVNPQLGQEVDVLTTTITDPLNPSDGVFVRTPRVPSTNAVVYVPLGVHPGGLVVLENETGTVLRHLDLDPSGPSMGFAVESAFDPASGLLYLSDLVRPGGLTIFDTNAETVVGRVVRENVGGKFPSLSPSRRRVFLSVAADQPAPAENWFIDATTFELISRIEVPGIGSSGSNASVFRPDGQLVFVVSGNGIAVYLNRE